MQFLNFAFPLSLQFTASSLCPSFSKTRNSSFGITSTVFSGCSHMIYLGLKAWTQRVWVFSYYLLLTLGFYSLELMSVVIWKLGSLIARTDTKYLWGIQYSDRSPESLPPSFRGYLWAQAAFQMLRYIHCGWTSKPTSLAQQTDCSLVPLTLVHFGLLDFLTERTDVCLSGVTSSSLCVSASKILVPRRGCFATTWISL